LQAQYKLLECLLDPRNNKDKLAQQFQEGPRAIGVRALKTNITISI